MYLVWEDVHQVFRVFCIIISVNSSDTARCHFNSTLQNLTKSITHWEYYMNDTCTIHYDAIRGRNIIAVFHNIPRQLTYEEGGRYLGIRVYDGDTKFQNATQLRRVSTYVTDNRYFKGISFFTRSSHLTVSHPPLPKSDAINLEIRDGVGIQGMISFSSFNISTRISEWNIYVYDCNEKFEGLTGEFKTQTYPSHSGLSYPINANCKINIIPFLGCSTSLQISKYDVENSDTVFIELGGNRTQVVGLMTYQIQPSESFNIVLDASSQTKAAQGIKGNFSVCYSLTFSLSGHVSLPLDPFKRENMSSACAFLIGSPIENITDVSITLTDVVTNTSSYVELYSGFKNPQLTKTINLSEWKGPEVYQSMSNETVIIYRVIQGNGIPRLRIKYTSRNDEESTSISWDTNSMQIEENTKTLLIGVIISVVASVITIVMAIALLVKRKRNSTPDPDTEESNKNFKEKIVDRDRNSGSYFVLEIPIAVNDVCKSETLYDDIPLDGNTGQMSQQKKEDENVYDIIM